MTRRRLDTELMRRDLAATRSRAQELIRRGAVLVGGAVASKPAHMVAPGAVSYTHLTLPTNREV